MVTSHPNRGLFWYEQLVNIPVCTTSALPIHLSVSVEVVVLAHLQSRQSTKPGLNSTVVKLPTPNRGFEVDCFDFLPLI